MSNQSNDARISRGVRAGISRGLALGIALAAAAASAQPDPGQPRTAPAPTIGTQTGKVLNAAIEALQAGRTTEARSTIARLDLAKLSPYERSKVEQILFNAAYTEESYDDARQHLQSAIDAGGLNAQEISQARYQAAQLSMTQENWREGAAALEEWFATAVNPNAATYYLLAVAYYQMDDFARALPPAQQAVDRANEPQEAWISLLLALRLRNEQYRDAIPLLQRLVTMLPEKKAYWMQLSSVYGQLEDYPNALSTAQVAYNAGLLTEDAEIRRLADLLLFQDLPYRGAQVLEVAIANDTVTVDAKLYEKLANCWLAAREYDKAAVPLARAADLSESGDLFVRLGEVHIQREDWAAARDALERAISKGRLADPAKPQYLMGIALYNERRLSEARAWFEQALQSPPLRGVAGDYLGLIESELGRPGAAERDGPSLGRPIF